MIIKWLKNYYAKLVDPQPLQTFQEDIRYQFTESYRSKSGKHMIVAKLIDNPRNVFKLTVAELVNDRKDLLRQFSTDDIINIVGIATMAGRPVVTQNKSNTTKFFALLAMLFATALITSNIASSKLATVFGITITGGMLPYVLTYALGDIITEVYGYKRTRQLIWGTIACNLFVVLFLTLAIDLPPDHIWQHQTEYSLVLGAVPRIVGASLTSYWCSEFINAYFLSKLKITWQGKNFWLRVILSSIASMTADNFIFLSLAYAGTIPFKSILSFSVELYILGLIFEWLCLPFVIFISKKLKKIEQLDIFDTTTHFTPFSFDVSYSEEANKNIC